MILEYRANRDLHAHMKTLFILLAHSESVEDPEIHHIVATACAPVATSKAACMLSI